MHVVVLGCGRVGAEIAAELDARGQGVAIVDRDRGSFQRLRSGFGGRAVTGDGIDRRVLEDAGIREAGAVAAVMYGDNSNIVAARIARENYEIPSVVARIKDPRRAEIYWRLGIPTVATVTWTTDQVLRRLFPEASTVDWTSSSGGLHLIERDLPEVWTGRRLDPLIDAEEYRLVAVTRTGESVLARHGLVGQEGDILHLMAPSSSIPVLESTLLEESAHQ